MTQTQQQLDELRHRVEARRKRLEASLEDSKADASETARNTAQSIRTKLSELDQHLRDGWDGMTAATVGKINEWLKDDE